MDAKTQNALNTTAHGMGVPADWLSKLIAFESGWNPLAKNKFTGARGLIQFMPSTAKALGYKDADDLVAKNPDSASQLYGPIQGYFNLPGNRGPYLTEQSLFMTVFYPAARKWSPDTLFPKEVRKVNPGIDTVQSYVDKVNRKKTLSTIASAGSSVVTFIVGIAALYFLFGKR